MTAQKNFRVNSFVTDKAIKAPVILVTTANVVSLIGAQTIETVVLAIGDRVLLNAQTDPADNGIYTVEQSAWNRAGDWDGNRDATNGTLIISTQTGFVVLWELQTTDEPFEPGTDDGVFVQSSLAREQSDVTSADLTEATTVIQTALGPIACLAEKFYQVEAHLVMFSNDLGQCPNAAIQFAYSGQDTPRAGRIDFNDIVSADDMQSLSGGLETLQNGIVMTTGGLGASVIVRAHHVLDTIGRSAGNLSLGFAVGNGSSGSPLVTLKTGSYLKVTELG